jgi:hypothetical protein
MSGAKLGVLEDVEDADSLIQQIANDSPETIL